MLSLSMNYRHAVIAIVAIAILTATGAQGPAPAVSIVLPSHLLANAPAMLAVLGADGHLAPGISVDTGNGAHVTTNATGRATFIAPAAGVFIANVSGVSAAALVDAAPAQSATLSVPPAVSEHDRFAVCGSGFSGDIAKDSVTINGDTAFIIAASPECLVALPQSRTLIGAAKIEIDSTGAPLTVTTDLVALDFLPPNPPLLPGHKGKLFVRAEGTSAALAIVVENASPDVIHFHRGERQQLRTSGGGQNMVPIEVQAIRSGDFSFDARILTAPDSADALRYIEAAAAVAPNQMQRNLQRIAANLTRHPGDTRKTRNALDRLANTLPPGTLRTLVDSARASL
jgi:hypothetical protein